MCTFTHCPSIDGNYKLQVLMPIHVIKKQWLLQTIKPKFNKCSILKSLLISKYLNTSLIVQLCGKGSNQCPFKLS